MKYDHYNREERAACAHLFRLLHERLATDSEGSPLARVLELLRPRLSLTDRSLKLEARGAALFSEVALVRDVYHERKREPGPFMDALVRVVKEQERVAEARLWSELPPVLSDPAQTHPRQIAWKGMQLGLLDRNELRVYAAVQALFNAKPDLALVLESRLIVLEAKLTQGFDAAQLARTRGIALVWASLLHEELGFSSPPPFHVVKLGNASAGVELSWQEVAGIAVETYPPHDRSRIALEAAARLAATKPRL